RGVRTGQGHSMVAARRCTLLQVTGRAGGVLLRQHRPAMTPGEAQASHSPEPVTAVPGATSHQPSP
ncbi:MAG: hypothetical protein ACT4NY_06620, partial [Pseudonocardiales bacterium]